MMMIMGIRRECKNGSRPRRMRRMGNDEKGVRYVTNLKEVFQ